MSYGYVGDSTPDTASLLGQGAFPHSEKPGSLIDGYSAALKKADARDIYHVTQGQEFKNPADGKTYRYDDVIPSWSKAKPGYVDVYEPNRAPDAGVSPKEIARQQAIASQRPGYNGSVGSQIVKGSVYGGGGNSSPATPSPDYAAAQHIVSTYAPNIKVATPDVVQGVDNYIKGGGDINNIPQADQLAISLAKDPTWLTKPENWKAFQEFVVKPQDQQFDFGKSVTDALNGVVPAIGQTVNDISAAVKNSADNAAGLANTLMQRFTGLAGDPNATQKSAQTTANAAAGYGQVAADVQNMVEAPLTVALSGATHAISSMMPGLSPDQRQSVEDQRAQILQRYAADQVNMTQYATQTQNAVAQAYKAIPLTNKFGDMVANAQADPAVGRGLSAIAQLGVPEAAGELAVSGIGRAFKPTFYEQAMYKAEAATAANAGATAAQITAAVPEGATIAGANEGLSTAREYISNAAQAHTDLGVTGGAVIKNMSQPGTVTSLLGSLTQVAGDSLSKVGNVLGGLNEHIESAYSGLAERLSGGNAAAKGPIQIGLGAIAEHALPGVLPGLVGAAGAAPALKALGEFTSGAGAELTAGMGSLPFWQRVQERTTNVASNIAAALDNPLVYALGDAAKGAAAGAATGAAMGGLSNVNDPVGGAVQGLAMGGIMGMVGGGFGQIRNFEDPQRLIQEQMGDWNRYRSMLSTSEKTGFDKLSSQNQLATATFMQNFPGVKINYADRPGAASSHVVDYNGRGVITLNTNRGQQTIQPILAHELAHQMAHNGAIPKIYDALMGDPTTGKIGQYTDMTDGKPTGIDPKTGRYLLNNDFQNLKNTYLNKLTGSVDASGRLITTDHLTDFHIAKEIYAEHGADYLLSGQATADSKSAFDSNWAKPGNVKQALMKIGMGFSTDGTLVHGSGLFEGGIARNPELDNLAKSYYETNRKSKLDWKPDNIPDRKFNDTDLHNPNVTGTFLDSAPEMMRDKTGAVVKDAAGRPVFKTKGEVTAVNKNMAQIADAKVSSLSADQKADIGYRQTGEKSWFSRYLPDEAADNALAANEHNEVQSTNFRMINKGLADPSQAGKQYNVFYHTAVHKGRYVSYSGISRDITPYGIEKASNDRLNIKAVDFHQLNDNFLRNQNNPKIKDIWRTDKGALDIAGFNKDANTYFSNHAANNPGETNIGKVKADAINALGKFGTKQHAEVNPLTDDLRGNSIIKSFALDRMNRVTPLEKVAPFTDVSQYDKMNANYHPEALRPSDTPVPYDIATAPLLGNKGTQLSKITQDTQVPQAVPDIRGKYGYLSKEDSNKLNVLASNGAVKKYGKAIADEVMRQRNTPKNEQRKSN